MSPLDDELRRTLQSRATLLDPTADPFAAVEARARSMKRRRTAGTVAGAALAVGLIAGGVPAVTAALDSPTTRKNPGLANTASASPSPSIDVTTSRYVLDPADPWDFRGDRMVLATGSEEAYAREIATRHGVEPDQLRFDPLFGHVWEPSALAEVVYVATVTTTGEVFWGVIGEAHAGPQVHYETTLDEDTSILAAPLPGDEVARLLIVTAPEVTSVEYAPTGSDWAAAVKTQTGAPGVFVKGLEGEPALDKLRALAGDEVIARIDAPDYVDQPSADGLPSNALDWPRRGEFDDTLELRAVAGFAKAIGADPATVEFRTLFLGENDSGQKYVLLQAWTQGGRAYSFGWIESPGEAPEPVLQPEIAPGTKVLALLLTEVPGSTVDQLVVVPAPGTGQVQYGEAASEWRDVGQGQDHLDGVVIVDRPVDAAGDKLRIYDGDGDLSAPPLFEGEVASLLCGVSGCS